MIVFWLVAGCLMVAALLFVLPPLFKRHVSDDIERTQINISIYKNQLTELESELANGEIAQEYYDKTREELERRLLEDTARADETTKEGGRGLQLGTAVGTALAIPLVAILLYNGLGNPGALDSQQMAQQSQSSPHGSSDAEVSAQIEMMVSRLAERLQKDPSDATGWAMLGRSFSVLGRYKESAQAFEYALNLVGEDAQILADYADALAMSTNESLEGKPRALLSQALKLDPTNQKALWLMGTANFERGDFDGAIRMWQRLQAQLPPGSDDARMMQANIAEAESYKQRQVKGEFGTPPAAESKQPSVTAAAVSGRVRLSPALKEKVNPADTVFIFAKAPAGPPMPLAIIRTQAGQLPAEFNLDETMAMMPGRSLANFEQVVIGARISKSGDAMPRSGDLQGEAGPLAVGSSGIEIVIDKVVP